MRMYNIEHMKMTPLAFVFVLVCSLLVTVSGQQSIVSTNTITSGGTFSVYCDVSRATTPPGASNSVQSLYIYRMVATDRNYTLIAQYNSLAPPGYPPEIRNIPSGRLWNITFSGANGGANNVDTMKTVMVVNDAMCSDAGMYRCQIDYYTATGTVHATAPDQNVTASTGMSVVDLSVQPDIPDNQMYYKDDNITFTCKVTGPATGVGFRWELWVEDSFGNQQPTNLPSNNEIVNNPAAPQTGSSGCPQFDWVSTLSIQVPADYEQQVYKCIVSYMQMQQSSNRTIGITGVNSPTPDKVSEGSSPDVGMIVGIVIGCVVAILIVVGIILFIRKRKRSQENRSGGKDQHDAPNDANLHAPPPVFYPSKQTKASKDEDTKIPTGMTNDALDTSYDSRDSTSKGPPRYANTESDAQGPPRYEKETHKGRQNRGYDEEERDRNGGHGRRQPRERQERQERKHRTRDYDDEEPRQRYYTTDDGTDSRQMDMGDPNMGTSI